MAFLLGKKKKTKHLHTIAFYNLENLFDTRDMAHSLDEDFTPGGKKRWTQKRYHKKLRKIAKALAELGQKTSQKYPALVGIAEVENASVIRDLLNTTPLNNGGYDFVHFESPDERGIDTALIYRSKRFEVLHSEAIPLDLTDANGVRDATRDIIYVHGKLNREPIHIFVNHWPSRREGTDLSEQKRVKAAETLVGFMDKLEEVYPSPNYIVMGDFNDDPDCKSIRTLVESKGLYNPMEKLLTPDRGSSNYKRSWSLFDQIIVSPTFFDYQKGSHSFAHANIFDDYFLTEWKGKYRGSPFRTFVGKKYIGGYSDHFPVYIQLKLHS